mgnify:CR=1 FL=1
MGSEMCIRDRVWIAAVVAVVLFIAVSFLLSLAGIDMFSLLGGNPAMQ